MKIAHQSDYRARRVYPPIADYLDAIVKQASAEAAVRAEGLAQEAAYKAACLAQKSKFPKESKS